MNLKKLLKYLLIFIILLFIFITHLPIVVNAKTSSEWYDSGEFRNSTYYRTYVRWKDTYQVISNVKQEIKVDDVIDYNNTILHINDFYSPSMEESVIYHANVASEGLYYLLLDYKYDCTYTSSPTIDLYINGEAQYNEMENLALDVSWNSVARDEDDLYNRYGDELLPYSESSDEVYHKYISDAFNDSTTPYLVLLKSGDNEIKIVSHQDNLLIGNLTIEGKKELISYDDYLKQYNGNKPSTIIQIEGENFTSKNDIEIKSSYYKSYKMSPSAYKTKVLNMLDGGSVSRSGSTVTYTFECEEEGLYSLAFKYKQNSLNGLAVGKTFYLDGEIPFKEMEDYLFPSNKKWSNYILNDGKNDYLFYLSKGIHTLSIESTANHIIDDLDKLYDVMDSVNSIGITINTITGSSSNTQITWKITNYLPNISEDLIAKAEVLEEVYDHINSLDPKSREASEVSTLKIASRQLRRLAKSPNKIQNRLAELSEGSGSCYQLIGAAIGYLINQSMDIDYMIFENNYKLPSANGNIFGRFFFGMKSFFYSFFDERYNIKLSGDDTIDVYIASSNLYTNIVQELIDDNFTKETGIKVKLNILSNNQAIILNNATGTNPDLVLEIDSWLPYTYALRGMLEDLSTYNGFDEICKTMYSANFTPLIFENGVYGIPETQGMNLLFYRKDILNALDLDVPDTWDDVLKMLPTLQSYQMNFYHSLGYNSAYKGFGLTSPIFYMYNAEMYNYNGFTSSLDTEDAVEAIKFMTDLFNVYNLPQQVSSFFECFRSGTLPVGIGGIDLYLQLKYACPELSGQWGVVPIPGVYNSETGKVERWTTTYGKCSIMFASSEKKDKAWKFLKWWHSTEVITNYVETIKSNLGEKYLIVPANIYALNASPWDLEIKEQVMLAAPWSRIPAITPGSYIVEREISNIWNSVVIDKTPVRVAINQSIPKINRELQRKLEEFKYIENGVKVKEYLIPTNSNISKWVKGYEFYE